MAILSNEFVEPRFAAMVIEIFKQPEFSNLLNYSTAEV